MNVLLWILQGLLALAFLAAGVMKSTQPKEKLAPNMPWVNDFSAGTVKFIGVAEFLGAVGLILPALTGIAVILTPIAAAALALTMALAAAYHVRKGEYSALGINGAIFLVAAFIAWGRFGPWPL
ncbi:DoxX family protein [Glycomyces endophyticus]|uniref:DoxX family protein n=1 Tax=Glycomyces endophyticus TaxID=480996 RepID=A0ABN2GV58_9ACTN